MNTHPPPKRLVDGDSKLGNLIRVAKPTYESPRNESKAWQKLEYRRKHVKEKRLLLLRRLAVPVAATIAVLIYVTPIKHSPQLAINADPTRIDVVRPSPSVTTEEEPTLQLPLEPVSSASPVTVSIPRVVSHVIDCSLVTRNSSSKDWLFCLEKRSLGHNLDAERALLDLSQYKDKTQKDPLSAITSLRTYRQRFPDGALRGEVDFLLIELLLRTGHGNEALTESDRLLGTAWGRARSSEVHFLRGRVAQEKLNDCALALKEFELVRSEFGNIGNEATLRSAECLERLADGSTAATYYEEYLARKNISRADYARTRLEQLKASNKN
jgi:hypothetical protein